MNKGWKGRHTVESLVHVGLDCLVRGSAVILIEANGL